MRLPIAHLSAVAFTAVLLVAGAQAPSEPTDGPTPAQATQLAEYLPEIEPSTELDGPVLVAGHVQDASAGVPVIATAWPSPAELGDLKVGDTVELVTIAKTLTDTDGNYELVADPAAVKDVVGTAKKVVNFDVTAPTSKDATATTGASAVLSVATVAATSDEVLVEGDIDSVASEPELIGEVTTSSADPDTNPDAEPASCGGATLVARYDDRPTIIGSSFSTTSKVTTDFEYQRGAESSLGYATSFTGKSGTFKNAGTRAVSSSSGTDYDTKKGAHKTIYKKYQDYGKFRYCFMSPGTLPVIQYQVAPIGVPNGSYTATATSTPTASYCVPYANASVYIERTKAQYWSSGVTLEGLIGMNLSAQTGWSSQTKLYIKRTSGTSFRLCGTNNEPEQTNSGRLIAKS